MFFYTNNAYYIPTNSVVRLEPKNHEPDKNLSNKTPVLYRLLAPSLSDFFPRSSFFHLLFPYMFFFLVSEMFYLLNIPKCFIIQNEWCPASATNCHPTPSSSVGKNGIGRVGHLEYYCPNQRRNAPITNEFSSRDRY